MNTIINAPPPPAPRDVYGLGPGKIERRKKIKPPKGRKFWITAHIFAWPFLACTVALFRGHMTDVTYVGFLQIQIPVCLAAFHAANVAQKVGLARAANGNDTRTTVEVTNVGQS
jgi:hypothetical protein